MKVEDIQTISKNTLLSSAYKVEHLGLVAATINKLGIIEKIDKLISLNGNHKTSIGERVCAFLLNGLSFINNRMYLFSKF